MSSETTAGTDLFVDNFSVEIIPPEALGTYNQAGEFNGEDYWEHENGGWFIWWNAGDGSWYISSGDAPGQNIDWQIDAFWYLNSLDVEGNYTPDGGAENAATVSF